jgi:hypothetical protein
MSKWLQVLAKLKHNAATFSLLKRWGIYVEYTKQWGTKWAVWQLDACKSFLEGKTEYTQWNWARELGKTEKASLLYVFCAIVGIQPYWFAATTTQLTRLQEHLNTNRFVKPFKISAMKKGAYLLDGTRIGFNVLSIENASGLHPDILFYDEVALMKSEAYGKTTGMLNGSKLKWRLSISTPTLGSLFHDLVEQFGCNLKTYLDADWFDHAAIEAGKIRGLEWQWEQENMCKFILPSGAVFMNVHQTTTFPSSSFQRITQGVDFNGQQNDNCGIRLAINGLNIYILREYRFKYRTEVELLQSWCKEYPTEVESGGWNTNYGDKVTGVSTFAFNGKDEYDRLKELLQCNIWIDKSLAPTLLKQLQGMCWDAKGKTNFSDNHMVAALLHAFKAQHSAVSFTKLDAKLYNPLDEYRKVY